MTCMVHEYLCKYPQLGLIIVSTGCQNWIYCHCKTQFCGPCRYIITWIHRHFLLFDNLSKWIKNPFWRLMTLYKINVCTHIHLELSHDHTFKIIIRVSSIITLIKQGSWQHPNHRNGLFLPTINPWCKGKFFIVLSYYSSWNLDFSFG